jgi:hypothetical protein
MQAVSLQEKPPAAENNLRTQTATAESPPALSSVHHVLTAVVSTIVPESSALDEQGWNKLVDLIESVLQGRSETLKRQLRLCLLAVQWLPVLRYARPFTALNQKDRNHCLRYLENHSAQLVRVGFSGLHTLALIGYYGQPTIASAIGYAASPRGWEALG